MGPMTGVFQTQRLPSRQVCGVALETLTQVLDDDVNLAIWQRQLPAHIANFCAVLLSMDEPLSESLSVEIDDEGSQPVLGCLARAYRDLDGYESFIADISWLVSAYACLLGAKRVGVRLRALDKAMCPRFHVDHVPVRLITTYAGIGSQWLEDSVIECGCLGLFDAEPVQEAAVQQIHCAEVALLKGEKWRGNEGRGLVHRSPALLNGERRLILTLDWLA